MVHWQVVRVGGLLQVEIANIDADDRIELRCVGILKQPKEGAIKKGKKGVASTSGTKKKQKAVDDDDEWSYDDVY